MSVTSTPPPPPPTVWRSLTLHSICVEWNRFRTGFDWTSMFRRRFSVGTLKSLCHLVVKMCQHTQGAVIFRSLEGWSSGEWQCVTWPVCQQPVCPLWLFYRVFPTSFFAPCLDWTGPPSCLWFRQVSWPVFLHHWPSSDTSGVHDVWAHFSDQIIIISTKTSLKKHKRQFHSQTVFFDRTSLRPGVGDKAPHHGETL